MIKGTKSSQILAVLAKIPQFRREAVQEVTVDFCPSMTLSIKNSCPNSVIVIDRFHVQKLVTEALQEMRVQSRWQAIKEENENVKKARKQKKQYCPKTYSNGDTKKQLLARSRYLLFKPKGQWTANQSQRANILFTNFPKLEEAYNLSMMFRSFYQYSTNKKQAKEMLDSWYKLVEEKGFDSFITTAEYIKTKEDTILNYFLNRSTNASAESFNAKLKGFRALVRGVRDKFFFLFRVSKLYG